MSVFDRVPWYRRTSFIVTVLISVTALAMLALVVVLIPQSEEVVRLMQWRMANIDAFRIETDIAWTGESRPDASAPFAEEALHVRSGGYVDRRDPAGAKQRHDISVVAGVDDPLGYGGEIRVFPKTLFIRLDDAPSTIGALPTDGLKGEWVRIEPDVLFGGISSAFLPGGRRYSDLERAYLLDRFGATPFLRYAGRLDSDTLRGAAMNRYAVVPEKLLMKDFFVAAQSLRLGRELSPDETRAVDTFFGDLTPEQGELWIGRGYLLHRMILRFRYDDGDREGTLVLQADFSEFGGRPDIAAPTDGLPRDISGSLSVLLPSIAAGLPAAEEGGDWIVDIDRRPSGGLGVFGGAERDADPDRDGLLTADEVFYGTDPNDPDTDRDGMNDGDEVAAGRNPRGPGRLFDFGLEGFLGGNSR